jgi:import inner membrane translocase subunit TIM17
VWGGLFSIFDCGLKGLRKKEDPWNAIGAGFFTGGSLAIRGGFKAARNGAIGCAILLAVIEGVGIGFSKMMAGGTKLEVSFPLGHSTPILASHYTNRSAPIGAFATCFSAQRRARSCLKRFLSRRSISTL